MDLGRKPTSRTANILFLSPPFLARGMLMRANYSAIDHLKAVLTRSTFVERFEHHIPKPGLGPWTKLAINTVLGLEIIGQIAPRRTCSCNPEHSIQDQSVALWQDALVGKQASPKPPLDAEVQPSMPMRLDGKLLRERAIGFARGRAPQHCGQPTPSIFDPA